METGIFVVVRHGTAGAYASHGDAWIHDVTTDGPLPREDATTTVIGPLPRDQAAAWLAHFRAVFAAFAASNV